MKIKKIDILDRIILMLPFAITAASAIQNSIPQLLILIVTLIFMITFFSKFFYQRISSLNLINYTKYVFLISILYISITLISSSSFLKDGYINDNFSIYIKFLFGPIILMLSSLVNWDLKNNRRKLLVSLILINSFLVIMMIFKGIETGFVFGSIHSNQMGVIALISLSVAYIFKRYDSRHKQLISILFYLSFICLILSLSRGAGLAILISLICIFYIRAFKYKTFINRAAFIVLFATILFLPFSYNNIISSSIAQPVVNLIEEISDKAIRENGRVKLWQTSIDLYYERPLLGYGADGRKSWDRVLKNGSEITLSPHNLFIAVLIEAGIFGLILLFFLLFNTYKVLTNYRNSISTLVFPFFIGVIVHQSFETSLTTGSVMVGAYFWFLFGIILSLSNELNYREYTKKI